MRLADLSIARKIGMAFAALIVCVACVGVAVEHDMRVLDSTRASSLKNNEIIAAALEARGAMTRQENSLRGFVLTKDEYYVGRIQKDTDTFLAQIRRIRAAAGGDATMVASLDKIESDLAGWHRDIADKVVPLGRNPATASDALGLLVSKTGDKFVDPVEDGLDAFRDEQVAGNLEDARLQTEVSARARLIFTLSIGLIALAAGAFGWALWRSISRPIVQLRDAMLRLADGDNTVEVPALGRKDEVGQIAASFERLGKMWVERSAMLEAADAAGIADAAAQRENDEISAGYVKAHEFFMAEVEAGFKRLSGGDLTARLASPFSSDYEAMRGLFNECVQSLEEAFTAVVRSIGSIRSGLSEISVASNDLAQRTEQQAASLEETVAALGEVTVAVNQTADGAGRAKAVATTTQATAEKSGEIVGRAVAAMGEIKNSSDQISKIIGVIDEIAFQTNLLALNAGVEAARAGEAGRGFAVVAQEVRGLAQRSAEAAKEIKSLISTSRLQVDQGVALVTASGASLSDIASQVGEMSGVVSDIARSAREQAVNLREVSAAADQMDKVTQQNAAMVEETTAAAQTLTSETEELAVLIARFRTSSSEAERVPGRQSGGRRRPHKAEPVHQMRSTGSGGAALAANTDAAAAGWKEF